MGGSRLAAGALDGAANDADESRVVSAFADHDPSTAYSLLRQVH
jgi:hypothetical protein